MRSVLLVRFTSSATSRVMHPPQQLMEKISRQKATVFDASNSKMLTPALVNESLTLAPFASLTSYSSGYLDLLKVIMLA